MPRSIALLASLCLLAPVHGWSKDEAESSPESDGKRSVLANADPNYGALRDGNLTETYRVENIVLTRDAATITLRSGQISFLGPVLGKYPIAVFSGEGMFQLKPAIAPEANYLSF